MSPRRRREPEFISYYGRPILNEPVWAATDIAGYFFLGGMAGASSLLAAGAELTDRPALARASKVGALGAISLSLVALVHDLGRPARFLNMLRVFKPTSPMSVGVWVLGAYAPAAGIAAASDLTGIARPAGRAAAAGAAALGPVVASYTSVLMCNTAIPAWHEGYREMPFVFVASAASAAAGLALVAVPCDQAGPARTLAVAGAVGELAASHRLTSRLGLVADTYDTGRAGTLIKAAKVMTAAGAVLGATAGRRTRPASMVAGAALLAASACTRFGIFAAGVASARDPKYVVAPQRERRASATPAA
nr:NrfD/PsrC family molybdoenzyme membrane anchor subunit [Baekduia soli]